MLTNDDKKFILQALDKRFDKLGEDVVDLFKATNFEIINVEKKLSEKIDKLSDKVDDINGVIVNHEHRVEKLEEKIFSITA